MPIGELSTPSADEAQAVIGENLAVDEDLCKAVLQHIFREYYYPFLLNQQRLHAIWYAIDRAWRCMTPSATLDYDLFAEKSEAWMKYVKDGKGNAGSANITPSDFYQQVNTLSAMAFEMSWRDGFPAKYTKPETMIEHPLYNPTQQSVEAANELLKQNANRADLKTLYRKLYPDYLRFSHAWAMFDYDRRLEMVPDPATGEMSPIPKTFYTTAAKLNIDQVYVDYLSPIQDMSKQECPTVRRMVTKLDLFANEYDPQLNPFGWLNIDLAIDKESTQYAFSQQDLAYAQSLLNTRYGITDTSGGQKPVNTVKQLYTSFAMLPLYQDPETGKIILATAPLDVADETGATKKVYVRPQRFVVEWYGYSGNPGGTCLRIQRNPTPDDGVPIQAIVHKIEDASMAIPVSVAEIAYSAFEQLSTAINQFLDSKNYTINRPFKVQAGSNNEKINLNKPGKNIIVDTMDEVQRMEGNAYDESATLLTFQGVAKSEIQAVFGGKDAILGDVAGGRRPATEMAAVIDSAKTPIVVDIDNFNRQFAGGYAKWNLANTNKWGDRDWIKKKTGLLFFPNMEIQTEMAREYMDRISAQNNVRYFIETFGNNPVFQGYLNTPGAVTKLAQLMGIQGLEEVINDGGYEMAKQEAMQTVTKILGDGIPIPPAPDDPDEMFLTVFSQALKDPYWWNHAPQNIPLLQQRIMLQQQQLQLKQLQQMQAQLQAEVIGMGMNGGSQGSNGSGQRSASGGNAPQTGGQEAQQTLGALMGGIR